MNSLLALALAFNCFLLYKFQLGSWVQPAGPSLSGNASDFGLGGSGSGGPGPASQTLTSGEAVKECGAEQGTTGRPSPSPSSQGLATGDIWIYLDRYLTGFACHRSCLLRGAHRASGGSEPCEGSWSCFYC